MSYVHRAIASILAVAFISLALILAVPSASATQIAQYFIHGKGNSGLASKGNVWSYWDNGNFLALGHGCGVPYDYSAVDGTFRIEDAAFGKYDWGGWANDPPGRMLSGPGVATQMADFIRRWGVTQLIVTTHSMGGNVLREILSDDKYWNWCAFDNAYTGTHDPLCAKLRDDQQLVMRTVTRVYAIAAPFTGSEAADLSATLSGSWLVGWIADWLNRFDAATFACTTRRMATMNAKTLFGTANRPWPGPYYAVWISAVSGLTPSQMGNDWAHLEDVELAGCAAVVPFAGGLSDGLVSYTSQRAVGTTPAYMIFHNNHYHAKYGSSGVWCDNVDCRGLPYGADVAMSISNWVESYAEAKCHNSCQSFCLP